MKKTSNTMYNIGRIFTIIEIILGPVLIFLGILLLILSTIIEDFDASFHCGRLIGYGIWMLVCGILCLVFVGKAKKELNDESTRNNKPFIITIVFGAIAGNVFYVLAGIFGLIAEGQQGEQPKEEPKQVEEPKEEPAEEPKAE